MGRIKINVGAVIELSPQIEKTNRLVSEVRINLNSTRAHVDGKILNRNNLYARLQAVSDKLASAENQISRIKSTVEGGANEYAAADQSVRALGITLRDNLAGASAAAPGGRTAFSAFAQKNQAPGEIGKKGAALFSQSLQEDWGLEGAAMSGGGIGAGGRSPDFKREARTDVPDTVDSEAIGTDRAAAEGKN